MNARDKFLAASTIAAALTWGTLTEAFSQSSTNDNNGKTKVVAASYHTPAAVNDTSKAKIVSDNNFEILPGKSSDAQDRAKKDGILGISIYYGKDSKYSAEQIATLLGNRLKEFGLKSSDVAFYVQKPDGTKGGVEIYIPPGDWFQGTVMRNGKPVPKEGTFSASEAYKLLGIVAETYKGARQAMANNQTASITLDHH